MNNHEFHVNDDKTVIGFNQYFKNANGIFKLVRSPYGEISKEYKIDWQPGYSAASIYAAGLQIVPKTPGTGILSISLQTTNAQMCADVINKLMEEYGIYSIEQKIKSSDQIIDFIDARLDDYGRKRDSVQKIYLDLQIKYNLFDADIQSNNYFSNIGLADKAINEQRLQLNLADMIDNYLSDKKNEFTKSIVPSSFGLEDNTLNELIGSYNKAQLERQQLLDANVTVDNPAMKEINSQIEQLRISIRENLKNIKSSINSSISETRLKSKESESQLMTLPVKAKELAVIKQQVAAYQELYGYLQTKKEETAISRASTIPNSAVVEKAYASNIPVKPSRRSIQIFAILLGIGLPALIIFIGEILNDKVTTRFDIEKITAAPILGEIGHSYSNKALIVNKTTRSMVAEQFRIIRSNLQYILNKTDKSVLLITSSFSGEGKSYVSTNMGAVLALAGKKTIILEFDIRKPKLLSGIGMPKGPGITNYLVGKATLEELIHPVPDQDNLFIIGCGPVPPNPAELLLDQRVEEMFTWLRTHFEMVLVDTAPVGMVSDAMTLSKFADA
ncbi:MAG: polysaccharide biosynthesis tyrosine autokinase, partial [Bacteroidia bacterium]|nr:polysaccharide biosynthesis tyrosine autokinase [Bacteroidia bacterium]